MGVCCANPRIRRCTLPGSLVISTCTKVLLADLSPTYLTNLTLHSVADGQVNLAVGLVVHQRIRTRWTRFEVVSSTQHPSFPPKSRPSRASPAEGCATAQHVESEMSHLLLTSYIQTYLAEDSLHCHHSRYPREYHCSALPGLNTYNVFQAPSHRPLTTSTPHNVPSFHTALVNMIDIYKSPKL